MSDLMLARVLGFALLSLAAACSREERRAVDAGDSPSAAVPMVTDSIGQKTADSAPPPPSGDGPTAGKDSAAGSTAPTVVLDDPQIAAVVVDANALDSAAGEIAKAKGAAKAVRDFAEMVITEHAGLNRQASSLAKRLGLKPEGSEIIRQLQSDADLSRSRLEALSGTAFDSAYIGHEIEFHRAVLAAMDRTLIPGAQDPELKRLVSQTRPVITSHLERARTIQRSLGKS